MVLERESPPRPLILENPLTCLSLATCHPNSFGRWTWGGSFFETLYQYSNARVFGTSTFTVGVRYSQGLGTSAAYRPSLIPDVPRYTPPSLSLPSFPPGAPHVLLLRTSFMTAFVAPHFPYALLMNTFGTLTNRVLGASSYRFAFVKLVCRWGGGGGEASQVRYLGFPCRAGITKDPEASISPGA